jgi:hypothetical protein
MVLVFGFASGDAVAGAITYDLSDHPTLQSGNHISGTITTDGTTGLISTANIQSWEFTISDSSNNPLVHVTSLTPGSVTTVSQLTATSSTLSVIDGGGLSQQLFELHDVISEGYLVEYDFSATLSARFFNDEYQTDALVRLWNTITSPPSPSSLEIAHVSTVPEPASFTLALLSLGGVAGAGYSRWLSRKDRH